MKKKLVVIVLCLLFFIVLCFKCIKIEKIDVNNPNLEEKTMATEEILMQVLNGQREFINNDGAELLISNLVIEDANVKVNTYSFADVDGDSNNELIALTDSYYGYYLVLHIDSSIIYGYYINSSDMDYINNDGIILDKVNDSIYYRRLIFDKNNYRKSNVASYSGDEYTINNTVVDKESFDIYQDEYALKGLVKYRNYNSSWMEKKLNSDYSIKSAYIYQVTSDDNDFVFSIDKKFDIFKNDLIEEKIYLYYIDSNNNEGRIFIKRINDSFDIFDEEISNCNCFGIYDEKTEYIALIINNDRLDSSSDNYYSIYYFKYFNKGIQFLGNHNSVDISDVFNEDIISDLQ